MTDHYPHGFRVSARGDWQIEILPLSDAYTIQVPRRVEDESDEVIRLTFEPDTVHIIGSKANPTHHFIVKGLYPDPCILVDTASPQFEGSVPLDKNTTFLIVISMGPRSLDISGK